VDLRDEDAVPNYMKIPGKVSHLRRLGMSYADIAERLGINIGWQKRRREEAKPVIEEGNELLA
jgi:hypothetical protein